MKGFLLVILLCIFLTLGIYITSVISLSDKSLRIIFCDVGQGDAIYVRTPSGIDMLIDGGPDEKVLSCLSRHMPFWDRSIDMVFVSHPHADHFVGLLSVLERYKVGMFLREDLVNNTEAYSVLSREVSSQKIKEKVLWRGDKIRFPDGVTVSVLGPTKSYIDITSPDKKINSSEFASMILKVSFGEFDGVFTGDTQLRQFREDFKESGRYKVEVLQIPHHGSKTGVDIELLREIKPSIAVVSVGKNSYGHPNKQVLEMLSQMKIKTLRTDVVGDIAIVSDGRKLEVR